MPPVKRMPPPASCTTTADMVYRDATVVGYTQTGLRVDVELSTGCEHCQKGGGCGAGLARRSRQWQVDVPVSCCSAESLKPPVLEIAFPLGSRVCISMPRRPLAYLALWAYATPLVVAILGVGVLSAAGMASGWRAPTLFFATLIVSIVALRFTNRRYGERFRPRLVN